MGRRHPLALDLVRTRQHLADPLDAAGNRLGCAAAVLDRERLQARALAQALGGEQPGDLIRFAAQAHHQHAGEVGMARVASQRALQDRQAFALGVDRTARTVRQRHHAIDVRKRGEGFGMDVATEVIGNRARNRRRAIHRGQYADVVARRDPAIGAHDPAEGGRPRHGRRHARVGAEGVVARELADRQVV
jgi:hypothetical protein